MKYYPICEQCANGVGKECHTPGCSFCFNDVPPKIQHPEFGIVPSELIPDGEIHAVQGNKVVGKIVNIDNE
jgi:hypothetical protein